MYVRMYVYEYMYVCIYVMYVCMYVGMYACVCVGFLVTNPVLVSETDIVKPQYSATHA